MKRFAGILAVVAGMLWAAPATALDMDLTPRWDDPGYGSQGLYLGDSSWSGKDHPYRNFQWTDASISVSQNGDAELWATMKRVYDMDMGYDLDWGLHVTLKDATFVGDVGSVADMETATDGSGVQWQSLTMEIMKPTNLPYSTGIPSKGWKGLSMDGHVASLMFNGGFDFDAWYTNPYSASSYYRRGDSKAHNPIPEPMSAAVFGLGTLLVLAAVRRSAQD